MIQKLKSKLNTKEGKTLTANFLSLSALQVANFVFPLITLPYLARVLGVEKFGVIALATAVVAYFQCLTEYGYNFTAVRDLAKNKSDLTKVRHIYSLTFFTRIVLVCLSFIVITICIYTIPYLYEIRMLLYFTFLLLPGYVLTSDWFFQGMEDMKFIAIFSFISKLIFTLLVFIVIKEEADYIYQPLLIAIGNLLVGVLSCWIVYKKYKIRFRIPSIIAIYNNLREGFNMFISNFIPTIYNQLNALLLGSTSNGERAVGIFSSGNNLVSMTYRIINVLSRAFYPLLARRMEKHSLYTKITFCFSLIMSLAFFILSDYLIAFFYTAEFSESAKVLRIMSFTPIAMFLMNAYGTNYLVLHNKEGLLKKIVLFTSIAGVVLTLLLMWKFSYLGVAVSSTTTQFLRGGIVFYFARKVKLKNK